MIHHVFIFCFRSLQWENWEYLQSSVPELKFLKRFVNGVLKIILIWQFVYLSTLQLYKYCTILLSLTQPSFKNNLTLFLKMVCFFCLLWGYFHLVCCLGNRDNARNIQFSKSNDRLGPWRRKKFRVKNSPREKLCFET